MLKKRGLLIWAHDFDTYWLDAAQRFGLTTLGLHPIPLLAADDSRSAEALLKALQEDSFRDKAEELYKRGCELEIEMHAMHLLLPHKEFAQHPNWFRMDEVGVRTGDLNFCPSNEEALEYVENSAAALAEQLAPFTRNHKYYLWIDDCSQYCHCEKCASLSPSDQALTIYNRILKGLRRVDPKAKESFLAYQATIAAPTKVRPAPGIFLEYAPIDRDSAFALGNPACLKNASQTVHIPALLALFGKEDATVLEYWMDNSRFYRWVHPFGEMPFYSSVLKQDVQYFREQGFAYITSFACGLNQAYVRQYNEHPMVEYGRILGEA
jgi:hypothetical protein